MTKQDKEAALLCILNEYCKLLEYWDELLAKRAARYDRCCDAGSPDSLLEDISKSIQEAMDMCNKYTELIRATSNDLVTY